MEPTNLHPVIAELITKTISDMEDTALQCSDASEHLEDGELLGALGALAGCEQRIRNATFIIRAAYEYQHKLSQTSGQLFAGNEAHFETPASSKEEASPPGDTPDANSEPERR
jgi:hypothetical protein